MNELIFLQDIAVVMAVSALSMIVCHRLGLPVVLGYLLVGMLIGPNTPPYSLVKDLHSIHTLAELGVIFLLFSIGLEFNFTRLAKVGVVAFFAATVEIILMLFIGFFLGKFFGWSQMDSLFLGAILSISSTTIIAKVLMDTKKIKEKFAQVVLGILIIEDLLAVVIIAVLSGIASTGSTEFQEVIFSVGKVAGFVGGVIFLGFLLVPRLLKYMEKFQNSEMTVISVLGLCFGVSLLAAKAGFSVALGAFIIGAVIAETPQAKNIIHKMEPLRDMFTAIFFVSVGMLIVPRTIYDYALPIVIITLVVIIGKVLSCSAATFLTGYNAQTSLKVGLGLAQIGEFSFIIAMLGERSGVTSPFLYPIAVSVSGITALTTPLLMRSEASIEKIFSRLMPKPLVTAVSLYTYWMERIQRGGAQKFAITKKLKPYALRLLLYGFGTGAMIYIFWRFREEFIFFPAGFYWPIAAAIVLPFLLGFTHTLDRFLWNALHLKLGNAQSPLEVNRTLQKSLRFLVSVGAGALFFAGAAAYWPWGALMGVSALLMVISAVPLWDSVTKFHDKIMNTVLQVFDQESGENAGSQESRKELVRLIQQEYPLSVVTEDFLLPFQESALNQPIRDLGLRSHTGATIVAIYRGEESLLNPSPETPLLPGDVLMLMGDADQIKEAVKYLYEKAKEPWVAPVQRQGVPKTASFQILSGSSFLGKTLREIKLRRNTGATILKIQKEDLAINNPDADTGLEEGDILTLFGWQDQLDRAARYLLNEKI